MDFVVTADTDTKILVKRYRISDADDVHLALGYKFNKECNELIEWVQTHLDYNPIQTEAITDYYCYQTIILIFFKFKNKSDAMEFLLVNNIEV